MCLCFFLQIRRLLRVQLVFGYSTLRPGIPVIALARLRIVVHLYLSLCRRVYEAFHSFLPILACLTDAGMVSCVLEEDTTDDQEAVDGQVDYKHDGNL